MFCCLTTDCMILPFFPETISAFAWEPTGNRFAFLHGESPRIGCSVYNIEKAGKVEKLGESFMLFIQIVQQAGGSFFPELNLMATGWMYRVFLVPDSGLKGLVFYRRLMFQHLAVWPRVNQKHSAGWGNSWFTQSPLTDTNISSATLVVYDIK